jgi:hypothetical protein
LSLAGKQHCHRQVAADVLVIHSSVYVSPGKQQLIDCMTDRFGLNVQQYVLGPWHQMMMRRHMLQPLYKTLPRFIIKAAMARYLVEKYRPKVVVISTEDTIAPFLRFEVNRIGGKLINIAHSVIFRSPLFAMCDYDYYFIYGQASLNSLCNNPNRFGTTRIVLSGSVDLSRHKELPREDVLPKRLTYFSTWLPRNQKAAFLLQFDEIREFALSNPDWVVVIRPHPLEDIAYWRKAALTASNIQLASLSEPIAESVRHSCVTLCPSHSTTALDSACLGRPPIVLDCDEAGQKFYDMFPALKRWPGEPIAVAINRVTQDNSSYQKVMTRFLNENLAQSGDVARTISDHISALCHGHQIKESMKLDSTICN